MIQGLRSEAVYRKYWMGPVVMKQKWPFSANRFEAVRRRDVSCVAPYVTPVVVHNEMAGICA